VAVFSIPHRGRIASCFSLAAVSGLAFSLEWPATPWICLLTGGAAIWICFERQRVEVDGKRVTFTRTFLGKAVGTPQMIDTSNGVRAILSVLLRRRGLPSPMRRIAFLKDGRAIAWTKDLPPDIEAPLLLSLKAEAALEVSVIESGGSFRPRVL